MINLDLTWQESAGAAVALAAAAAAMLRQGGTRPWAGAGRFVREAALFFALFALWQYAGSFALLGADGAADRGLWIWRAERTLRLPSETAVQHFFLPHPLLIQGFNLYYDILHFPVLLACLIWLFVRHRDRYGQFRTTLVALTGASLLIQLIPVAPPRLLPGTGMVDTALQYGQSVYSAAGGFEADQLSAMPSVHVGWAILVAVGVITAARTPWRWLALAYPALTMLAVVVTANHFWADGIVAGVLLAAVMAVQYAVGQQRSAPPRLHSGQPAAKRMNDDADDREALYPLDRREAVDRHGTQPAR